MLYLFEDHILDPARRELRHKEAVVAVEPQVFDLLLYLIDNRHRVVSKDDLIASVWGGRIVSDSTLTSRINAARRAIRDDGTQQRLIRTLARKGVRFLGEVREVAEQPEAAAPMSSAMPHQEIRFCRSADGINLALACVGNGPPLVKTANWLTHLEYDWESPIWAPFLHRLASHSRLIRYDSRGNGLSDREVADISFAAFARDLDAVVAAAGVERAALLGMSQGASIAIDYAVRHPERVSKLILLGGYPQGRNRRDSPEQQEMARAFLSIMRHGWGDEHSAFMKAFSSVYLPNGSAEQIKWFVDLQRITTNADIAARIRTALDDIDVVDLLPKVRAPTLVLHCRHDNVVPVEQGRLLAASIPQARFVTLESENHIVLQGEPAWTRLTDEIERFLGE